VEGREISSGNNVRKGVGHWSVVRYTNPSKNKKGVLDECAIGIMQGACSSELDTGQDKSVAAIHRVTNANAVIEFPIRRLGRILNQ